MLSTDLHIPRPGWYQTRLVKGGPKVPVWICERGERDPETGEPLEDIEILVEVAGRLVEDEDRKALAIERINLFAEPITKARYDYLTADADHCRRYLPGEPRANPFEPVDFETMETIF